MSATGTPRDVVDRLFREESGRAVATLIRVLGDVPKAAAVAATVLIRLATLWFAVAIGLVGLAVEERLARRQRQPVSARRSSMR